MLKVSNDVDTLLFSGTLSHRVLVHWIDVAIYFEAVGNGFPGESHLNKDTAAFTNGPPPPIRQYVRPAIYFDAAQGFEQQQSRGFALDLFVHEMLHAYLFVATEGLRWRRSGGINALFHGPLSRVTCNVLAERLGFPGA
ncbi:hypothetical protein LTR36_002159 [Oleoguttula mirabilis]|uniref:SprT-like domain-containing protein n=1 Tax=Oleoguttula mirabilis TaxID=1507867 RepID=A0AAV9JKM1_9PEZI|nr:hypothetical protein LTR36_002159 [Oleoguttula mirabilis]